MVNGSCSHDGSSVFISFDNQILHLQECDGFAVVTSLEGYFEAQLFIETDCFLNIVCRNPKMLAAWAEIFYVRNILFFND